MVYISGCISGKMQNYLKNYYMHRVLGVVPQCDIKKDYLVARVESLQGRIRKMEHDMQQQRITYAAAAARVNTLSLTVWNLRRKVENNLLDPQTQEHILIYKQEEDEDLTLRIKAGRHDYLQKYIKESSWYIQLEHISNSKRAINILKQEGHLQVGKSCIFAFANAKAMQYVSDVLRGLNESYRNI